MDKTESQYINLVKEIIENGYTETNGRNGTVKSLFGYSMRYSLRDNVVPILTCKKTAWKTCLKELLWFIGGYTNNEILQKQNVHIWDANSTREFLDAQNLTYDEGILGPIYGFQWRHFNATYDPENGSPVTKGVDQLQYIIESLKHPTKRFSRRLILSAWNPEQLDQMALPPCHIMCQFSVHDNNKLSCALYQRSNDVSLGTPFNIASYALLTHLLAHHCGLVAHEFIHFMGNCHIYEEHIEPMKQVLSRQIHPFPTIRINKLRDNIDDYSVGDFEIINYQSNEVIKMNMVA